MSEIENSDTSISSPRKYSGVRRSEQKRDGYSRIFIVVGLVLLYYCISISISAFNTQVISKSRLNFPYPLFAALIYDIIQFSLAFSIMSTRSLLKSGPGPISAFRSLGWTRFYKTIVPCAFAAGLDIALSNCSLKFVSLSFYTMIKSSSPVFILLFAFILRIEKPSWTVAAIILVIGFGTLLTVWNPVGFDPFGFSLVFMAAVMSGARWALTQMIIENQSNRVVASGTEETPENAKAKVASGPLAAILFLTPPIGLTMFALCQIFEGFPTIIASPLFSTPQMIVRTCGICAAGGLLTFSLILTEYKVVEMTSVVTFSIAGILKELGMIAISIVVFGDKLLAINYIGLAISISGITAYNFHKIHRNKRKNTRRTRFGGGLATAPSDFYLAVPTAEPPLPALINPFLVDDDYFIELEERDLSRSALSRQSSYSRSPVKDERSTSRVSEVDAHFDLMKKAWSRQPSIEHHSNLQITYTNTIDKGQKTSKGAQI